MLTGEYAVLDGAKAIGLPTKQGQKLLVKPSRGSDLVWHSYDNEGNRWFEAHFSLFDFSALKTSDENKSKRISKLLKNAVRLNSEFLDKWNGFKVETSLEFPLDWGLGSSSSLVQLLSQWAEINPLLLHFRVSNGSGYDVACSGSDRPIYYVSSADEVSYSSIDFNPSFTKNLYFVHLGEKQDSEDQVKFYLKSGKNRKSVAKEINRISESILDCKDLNTFDGLLTEHEEILAKALGRKRVKEEKFDDYWGCVKSLGAWGGDFVLASSKKSADETKGYFASKGYSTVRSYSDLIL